MKQYFISTNKFLENQLLNDMAIVAFVFLVALNSFLVFLSFEVNWTNQRTKGKNDFCFFPYFIYGFHINFSMLDHIYTYIFYRTLMFCSARICSFFSLAIIMLICFVVLMFGGYVIVFLFLLPLLFFGSFFFFGFNS